MRLALACLALAIACGGPGAARSTGGVHADDAVIQLMCEVAEAEVYVNDRLVGRIADLRGGLALSPGDHRLEIRHDDFHAAYLEITVTAKQRRTLEVDLAPLLP